MSFQVSCYKILVCNRETKSRKVQRLQMRSLPRAPEVYRMFGSGRGKKKKNPRNKIPPESGYRFEFPERTLIKNLKFVTGNFKIIIPYQIKLVYDTGRTYSDPNIKCSSNKFY